MAPSTTIDVRKLSKRAKLLGIRGYQKMSPKELRVAVKREEDSYEDIAKPKKTKTKPKSKPKASTTKPAAKPKSKTKVAKNGTKKPATKTKAKVAKKGKKENLTGDPANPFRPGCNQWRMAEELLKGGKRSDMIKRLKKSMKINPWSKDEEEDLDFAINKRLLLVAKALRVDYGFKEKREGRGSAGTIKLSPPSKKPKSSPTIEKAKRKSSTSKTSSKKKSAGQRPKKKASSSKTTSKGKAKAKR